ncbi:MAG TPA: PDZ domain-containing protein [Pirellulales bacterium]|nr:PDZ domain-containing protein [Pirellulales bacterium]
MRHTTLLLVAITALLLPRAALAQALQRAESQLHEPETNGPELLGAPSAGTPAQKSGYLGIKADDRGAGQGVRIVEVVEGGPAEAAGLQVGDQIAAVHGKNVATMDDFAALLRQMSVGTHVVFDVERGGQRQSIEVVLGTKAPTAATVPQIRLGPSPPRGETIGASPVSTGAIRSADRPAPLGIRVEMIDDAARRARNLPADVGVLVTRVTKNSAAAKAGVSVGAVVLAIDGQRIASPDEAAAALGRARVGQPVAFAMNEDGRQVTRSVTPEASAASPPRVTKYPDGSPARDDPAPATGPGRSGNRPMATINSEIDDARKTIRRLQERVVELERELEALQDKAEKRRDDILETEEALRRAAPKSRARALPGEP